ncbi:MAG: translation elongation factor Ts, partial [Spirochaetes bacterium]|nr:translation elongation factor Ts [Spirochaetota bacterium]
MKITANDIRALREATGAGIMECREALTACNNNFEESAAFLKAAAQEAANKRADRETAEGKIFTALDSNKLVAVTLSCETDFVVRNKLFNETGTQCAQDALKSESLDEKTEQLLSSHIVDAIARIKEHIRLKQVSYLQAGSDELIASYSHNNGQIFSAFSYTLTNSSSANREIIHNLLSDLTLQIAANAPQYVKRESIAESYIQEKMEEFKQEFEDSGKPPHLAEKILTGKLVKHLQGLCL